jgi:hypothetical protein
MDNTTINQSDLNRFSPAYYQLRNKWIDAINLYEPVPGSLSNFLTRYSKEDPEEFAQRSKRVAQFNIIKMVIDFYGSMLFSTNLTATANDNYKADVEEFVNNCNPRGDSLWDFYREQVFPQAALYGNVDVFTDLPASPSGAISLQQQQEQGLDKPYCFLVPPINRVRWQVGPDDSYTYYQALDVAETQINPQFQIKQQDQYQCWTLDTVYSYDKKGTLVDIKPNPYGFIPAVCVTPQPSIRFYEDKLGDPLIDGLIELQKEVINTLSLISDYHASINFALLVFIQDISDGAEPMQESELTEVGNKRAAHLEGSGSKVQFVGPEPAGVKSMQDYLDQLLDKMFQLKLIPISGTDIKTHTSSSTIRSNLSTLYNALSRMAKHLERSVKQLLEMMLRVKYAGDPSFNVRNAAVAVQWNTNFSYESFINNLTQLATLKQTASDLSPTFVKEYAKKVAMSELYNIPENKKEEIISEMEKWNNKPTEVGKTVPVNLTPVRSITSDVNAANKVANTD